MSCFSPALKAQSAEGHSHSTPVEQLTRVPDFSALFAASPYPYLLVGTDYVIVGANPAYCRATARTAEELVGLHIFDAFPANPADPESTNLEEVRSSIERAIATRQPHTSSLLRYAVPVQTPEGPGYEDRYWSAVHTPVLDAQGAVAFVAQNAIDVTQLYNFDERSRSYRLKPAGAAASLPRMDLTQMDVTQLHSALMRVLALEQAQKEQLEAADRRKDEFLAMLAHELRNPLAPIRTAAELLSVASGNQALVLQTSAVIARQTRHLTSLVDDLLDVSRVTRGLVSLDRRQLDMKTVVADACEQARPLIESKGHRLVVDICPEPALVLGDATRLVQVFGNLLNNAAKYTGNGGRIRVELRAGDGDVVLAVEDDGIGMSGELIRHVFDVFTQAERTRDRAQGGLGIGLALVRVLIELHGGTVSARSEGAGRGSAFTVRLPRLAPAERPMSVEGLSVAGPDPALRILVVDDNEDAATTLGMLLEAMGHVVSVETGAQAGLARATSQPHDVCLLDIGMPVMDGYALARQLRLHPTLRGCVLVAVTGYGQDGDRLQSAAAGFDHHLVKPVAMADVERILGLVAAHRHA